MAYLVKIMPRAERDLEDIFQYIQADSSQAASAWFTRLAEAIGSLSALPSRNAITAEDPELRQLLFGTKPHIYRIIYAIDLLKKTVSIVHVRHGARSTFERTSGL